MTNPSNVRTIKMNTLPNNQAITPTPKPTVQEAQAEKGEGMNIPDVSKKPKQPFYKHTNLKASLSEAMTKSFLSFDPIRKAVVNDLIAEAIETNGTGDLNDNLINIINQYK